ncbi:AbrB/MazE/SpoVT family DNA-binding domain-containing protein [Methylacidimicrobium tartarophylax]|uniref:SpoVT-AbrB domain-containing protein n=1 Tax=Methylacidimicrobium tartarophylax TaxID=1041768 RepID=A0A5E6M5T7_9BACT|nr:AbrB/MazE/SpoVT family DNA-binding domain-containing protein [Methylacidimicrobium tartarophylax]VVM04678.1 hypothetical protein MAMT_00230 [Methylacidimicrobium tartarophylax]
MRTRVTLDPWGRIVIPKSVREELQLSPGDRLELEKIDEQILLRPLRGRASLRKKHGVWVFRSGEPLSAETVERTIAEVRSGTEQPTG